MGADRTRIIDCPGVERLLECGLIARRKTDKVLGLSIQSVQSAVLSETNSRHEKNLCQKNNILGNSSTEDAETK
jgi:hypothetical protein